MKKSVILIIGLIYIVSVVIVGFIGLQMRVYDPQIYVEDIQCSVTNLEPTDIGEEYMKEYGCDYYYVIPPITKDTTIEVKCRVIPENATNTAVDFFLDSKDSEYMTISASNNIALVTFIYSLEDDGGSYSLKVKSTDGTNLQKVLRFRVRLI